VSDISAFLIRGFRHQTWFAMRHSASSPLFVPPQETEVASAPAPSLSG
jgi:hypothetical protein